MTTIETVIVGTAAKGAQARETLSRLGTGEEVTLRREPLNRYDDNAVACYVAGVHCGFIPRVANPPLARALDRGAQASCTIIERLRLSPRGGVIDEAKVRVRFDE